MISFNGVRENFRDCAYNETANSDESGYSRLGELPLCRSPNMLDERVNSNDFQ